MEAFSLAGMRVLRLTNSHTLNCGPDGMVQMLDLAAPSGLEPAHMMRRVLAAGRLARPPGGRTDRGVSLLR